MGIKPHENVSFSCFGVYFFIHLNIAIVSISLFSFLVVMVRFLRITIFLLDKSVIVRKRFFSIGLFVAGFCCILPLILCSCCRPRLERKHKGSLVQIDGTPYDFFMDGTKVTAVGAIDDASHSLLGIHFSIAESRMSYFELFHQMAEKHVLPESFYTDWSRNFISVARNNAKMSVEERIEYAKEHKTEYMKICEKLGIKTIFALSPEAKGRVERMWQTLQLNLPMMFKRRGISTIEKANGFSRDICEWWNKYFSIEPLEEEERYITPPSDIDLEDLFSVHKEVTTKRDGIFSYCEHDFKIDGLSWGGEKINLSISYRNGFRVFWHNSWRRARLQDGLQRTYGDTMSNTEYELLAKKLEADMHTNCVCV